MERTEEQQEAIDLRIATSKLRRSVELSLVSKTQVMVVTVNSDKPKLAATIANALAEEYIDNYFQSLKHKTFYLIHKYDHVILFKISDKNIINKKTTKGDKSKFPNIGIYLLTIFRIGS